MEKVCFPKSLLPVSFLTLKFTQVLENIHKDIQDMGFTGQSRVTAQCCSGHLGERSRVHLHSSKEP